MVSFRIESGNRGEPFEINNQTGEVTRVKALDFEDISSYQITIVAFDGGNPPLSSVATLRVAVINIDESPPRFQLPCEVTLDEVDVTPPDLLRLLSCLKVQVISSNQFSRGLLVLKRVVQFTSKAVY